MADVDASSNAPTATTAQGALDRMVRADQLLSVRRSVRAVVPSGMAVGTAAAVVAMYSPHLSPSPRSWGLPMAWLLLMVLSNAFRAFVSRPVDSGPPADAGAHADAEAGLLDERVIARQLRRVTFSSFLSGCVWALLPVFCSKAVPAETLFFMTVVCGVCAGSVIYSAAYAPVPVAFVTPALAAVTAWLVWAGGFHHNALALMVFVYLGTLVHASLRGDRAFRASSRLKNEALFMASELRHAHAQSSRAARELDFRANHDSLTGLLNREGFFAATSRFCEDTGARRDHAALMLDLDGFKAVNDAFGHKTGDQVLQDVGRWLQERLSRHHAVVGRWGGDEFAVFYQPRGAQDAPERVAGELIASIGEATSHYGGQLGVSVGICTERDCTVAEMLSFSDEALYEAKRRGRNRCHRFDDALHARLLSRRDIERDLTDAIASRAICVWYQPILGEGGRRLHSLEALLRWQHPRHGWVAPADVIYAAANTGLAERLLRHILDEICLGLRQLASAGARFAEVPVAMNVSPREMSQLPVDAIVLEVLARHGLPPRLPADRDHGRSGAGHLGREDAAARAGRGGRRHRDRRLRRGLLVARVAARRARAPGEDRPQLRAQPGVVARQPADGGGGDTAGPVAVHRGGGRRAWRTAKSSRRLNALGSPLLQGYYFMRPAPLDKVIAWAAQREGASAAQA
jgi:diguanylate cyclase (GGDEF)-like protein